MLQEFVEVHRGEIIQRCRMKVALRTAPPVTPAEIDHGVPMFLDQLASELRRHIGQDGTTAAAPTEDISATAAAHGHDLSLQGFSASQVVHDYGDVCQSITELAVEKQALICADDFRVLNKCLDNAIAGAITEHGRLRDVTMAESSARDGRIRTLAEGVRITLDAVRVSFNVLRGGQVGIGGATGALLDRHLQRAEDLTDRLRAELSDSPVRADAESQHGP